MEETESDWSETVPGWGRSPEPSTRDDSLGSGARLGRYVLLNRLGAGAMGFVFAAWDPDLDRRLAIKVLNTAMRNAGAALQARLLREAQALARLDHPNVIAIHDVGVFEGSVFIAMEFVAGQTLTKRLAAGELGWEQIVELFIPAGRGLAAAHAAGLIHRDFKPDNVIVGDDGRVRVLDFGLARRADGEVDPKQGTASAAQPAAGVDLRLTATGTVMGTPAYMPPEQFGVLPASESLDGRTDQYAFCVALWKALTGELPFADDNLPTLVHAKTQGELRPFPRSDVPDRIRRALQRGLAMSRDERWPDMDSLLAQLEVRPRRLLPWGVAGLVCSVLTIVGVVVVDGLAGPEDPCAAARDRAAQLWTPELRQNLDRAFAQIDQAWADRAREDVSSFLDSWATRWSAANLEACEARFVRRELSDVHFDRRAACLERARQSFDTLVELLADADRGGLERASEAVSELPLVEACSDAEHLRERAAEPTDPRVRAQIRDLRERLERVRQLQALSTPTRRHFEGDDGLDAIVREAEALGFAPFTAEALLARMDAHARLRQPIQASADASAALVAARVGGVAVDEGLAAIGLAEAASHRQDLEEARRWQGLAEAVAIAQADPKLERSLLELRSRLAYDGGDWERALAHDEQRAELLRVRYGADSVQYANAGVEIGRLLVERGEHQRGIAELERGLELLRARLGEEHPDIAVALEHLGVGLLLAGRHAEALPILEQAEQLWHASGRIHDQTHLDLVRYRSVALSELGRCEEARRELSEARAWCREEFGEPSFAYAISTLYLGWPCGWTGAEAFDHADEAVRILEQLGEDRWLVAEAARLERGMTQLVRGDTAGARADFDAVAETLARRSASEESRRVWGIDAALEAGLALIDLAEQRNSEDARARLEALAARPEDFRFRTRPIHEMIVAALAER